MVDWFQEAIIDLINKESLANVIRRYGFKRGYFLKLNDHRDSYYVVSRNRVKLVNLARDIEALRDETIRRLKLAETPEEEMEIEREYSYALRMLLDDPEIYVYHESEKRDVYRYAYDIIIVNTGMDYLVCELLGEVDIY